MAFYGDGAGITNLVGGTNGTSTSTSSNRNLSSSYVTHLSRTLSVPSGHMAHVICIGHFPMAYESSAGAYEVRCLVSGTQSITGTNYQNHAGFSDNNAGGMDPTWGFTIPAGSYTFSLQAREWQGNVELNRHGGADKFLVQAYFVRD